MEIHVHIHDHRSAVLEKVLSKLDFLTRQNHTIIMTEAEEIVLLKDMKAQNEKAKAEIVGKISALETALANAGTKSPEVTAALLDLKGSIQGTDDIVADPVPEPAPEPTV